MRYFIVDAFAQGAYLGNPAGVCLPEQPLSTRQMQRIAAENNLPETAFVTRARGAYQIRWFTPAGEVDLCGHATLASAFVIRHVLEPHAERVTFQSVSGPLYVDAVEECFRLDFPARPARRTEPLPQIEAALGAKPLETYLARDWLVVLDSEQTVRGLQPDFAAMAKIPQGDGVIVTARGESCDFVSRCFYPKSGVNEDPVTGSAHCNLTPYWAERLGKTRLVARQLSARGGALACALAGDRVLLTGGARLYLSGEISTAYLSEELS